MYRSTERLCPSRMTGASRRLKARGSAARRRAWAAASSAISVSALASTTMSPGVCARSTAADPSAMIPGSVARRCIRSTRHCEEPQATKQSRSAEGQVGQKLLRCARNDASNLRSQRRSDGTTIETLLADHHQPREALLAHLPRAIEIMLHPIAHRLDHLPAVAARQREKTLCPQDVMRADNRDKAAAKRLSVGDGSERHHKTIEIVVVMLAFEFVHRWPRGEIVFRRGVEAERDPRRDFAVARGDDTDTGPQTRRDLRCQPRQLVGRDQIRLV